MRCPKCQFENRDMARFCKECGSPLEATCPKCGSAVEPDSKFCDGCGYALQKPKEISKVDYAQPHSYTPKHLADKILTTRSSLEGERKLVTVLFADVANYTSLSEKLDPEEVHQIMDGCFKILMDEIHKYEGTINQFTGDGVMALFGAPLAHEDHAQRACHAALAIQKAMKEYGDKVIKDFGVEFRIRIGINSGPVIVGAIGDDLRMDYTAVGNTTNLASRMQTMAQPGTVLVSKHTHRLAKDYFELKPLGKLEVKGKEEPQEVFELTKAAGATTRLEASVSRGLTKFVGRQHSMAALMEAYEKVKNGTGQVVGVVGEAGVGKSRLLFEFRHRLTKDEFNYLEGRCIHYGGSMPYLPILDILRSYFEIGEGEREAILRKRVKERIIALDEKLQRVLPPIQDLLSLKVEDEAYLKLEPKQRKEKVFEALRDLIVRGSQERPLVIAIEDLHWIDKTSEEFLDYFIGWLANVKVMLLLLHRPEYTHRWGSKSYFNRIGLDQLTLKSSAELVKAILEGGETAPELSDLILNRAAGNPLFMEELTHSLLENGSIRMKDKQYVLAMAPSDLQVPETIQGIIAARMDRLEDNLKRTMQVASVIGRDFAFRILQTITGMRQELKSYLLNLQGLEFVYEKSLFPELEYIFKHALTQEVAYNSLLLKRRKDIHEKIGRAIEELYAERLEEFYEMLAYHYSRSEEASRACHYLKLSGDKSKRNYSMSEAFTFYKEALHLLRGQPVSNDNSLFRLDILKAMAFPMRMIGHPEGSLRFLEEGESLAQDLNDRKALAFFQSYIGNYYMISSGDPAKGREYIKRGLGESELKEEVEIIVPTITDLIPTYMTEGNYFTVCEIAPKIIELLEKTNTEHELFDRPTNPYSILLGYYGQSLGLTGKFAEGEQMLEKGLKYAREIGNLLSVAYVEMLYGTFYWAKGDAKNQVKHFLPAIEGMEKGEFRLFLGLVWAWLGMGYLYLGRAEKALQCTKKGLKIHSDVGLPFFLGSIYLVLSEIHLHLGNFDKAMTHAEKAVSISQTNSDGFFEAYAKIALGRAIAAISKERFQEARKQIVQGATMLDHLQVKPSYAVGLLRLGELYADTGQMEEALDNLKKAEGMFKEMGMDYWLGKAREVLAVL